MAFFQRGRSQHHNFAEHFVFEPHLEPGIPPQQKAELDAAGVRVIHVLGGQFGPDGDFDFFSEAQTAQPCGPCANVLRADVTGDQLTDGRDVARFVHVLLGGVAPPAAVCGADINRDGSANLADTVLFVNCLLGQCP